MYVIHNLGTTTKGSNSFEDFYKERQLKIQISVLLLCSLCKACEKYFDRKTTTLNLMFGIKLKQNLKHMHAIYLRMRYVCG